MAIQFSVRVRNARLDAIETAIGVSPVLEIRSGAKPINCAAADTGTVLASLALPSDYMSAAASGFKQLLGTWQDLSADATGVAGHFRLKGGGTCDMQGDITATGGGGDMLLDNTSLATGQQFTITGFGITDGNA
ncbi:hypothetical protein [Aquidulcibacter sp.]|uniref:hypothetical protein n=1 Tax=Aquidulcibacter sp. TaxID=2052990 RepID=UPI0025C41DBC|nr:hypothetical protein [Aquidulcibacter sp.]MCA3695303.1 hypothetical protein [Aquidulcibacter sp.]